MSKGLSNFQIDHFFKEEENDDLKNNYMGTYWIDSITKYIHFYEIIKRRKVKYPFAIFNTDKENQPGVHWWSFMDINPRNNQDIVNELLYNFKKCESKSNQKLELCTMNFRVETWQKMSHKKKISLHRHSSKFFSFVRTICKFKKDSLHEHLYIRKANLGFN